MSRYTENCITVSTRKVNQHRSDVLATFPDGTRATFHPHDYAAEQILYLADVMGLEVQDPDDVLGGAS